jgi:predicted alpha/beta hydrolase family esterase
MEICVGAERQVLNLPSLREASEAARRAITTQPGPTVLVGHSFSGMIVTEVGVAA